MNFSLILALLLLRPITTTAAVSLLNLLLRPAHEVLELRP